MQADLRGMFTHNPFFDLVDYLPDMAAIRPRDFHGCVLLSREDSMRLSGCQMHPVAGCHAVEFD